MEARRAKMIRDFAIVAAATFATFAALLYLNDTCHGSPPVCRTCSPLAAHARALVAPSIVYNAVPFSAVQYNPATFALVGAQMRLQAGQQQEMLNDPDWQAFKDFKEFRKYEAFAAQRAAATAATGGELPPTGETQPPTSAPPSPPAADPARPFAASIPALVARCGSCHGQKNPDDAAGGLYLDGAADILAPESWRKREAIMERLLTDDPGRRMPRGGSLSVDEYTAIFYELWGDGAAQIRQGLTPPK